MGETWPSSFLRRALCRVKLCVKPNICAWLALTSGPKGFGWPDAAHALWCLWTLQGAGNDEISCQGPCEVTNLLHGQPGALSPATLFSFAL